MGMKEKRWLHEVVEVTRDCEIGKQGERAIVLSLASNDVTLEARYMTLLFPDRSPTERKVHTGADYAYLRSVTSAREF